MSPSVLFRALAATALSLLPVSAAPDTAFRPVIDALANHDARIDSITAYLIPVEAERKFSYTMQKGRLHAFVRFSAGGKSGWTEIKFPELPASGLYACEDPARMSPAQWAALQSAVGDLDLLPDAPLRPAWDAPKTLDADMGRVFNMHPAGMGSIEETVKLGRLIQSWNRKLMVGDDSLIGPACSAWTQIAIGLGADWVEAVEKPQESDVFQSCVTINPVGRGPDGRFVILERLPGWGVEIDEEKLRALATETVDLAPAQNLSKPSH